MTNDERTREKRLNGYPETLVADYGHNAGDNMIVIAGAFGGTWFI